MPEAVLPQHRRVLDRFVELAKSDQRVVAAVLSGSYARGAADEHSDLDLGLITTDLDFEPVLANREALAQQLGELLLCVDFGNPHVLFMIYADGAEVELAIGSQSRLDTLHSGPFRILVDKAKVLEGAQLGSEARADADQLESLQQLVLWFWHDLSHFTTAVARGHLWWAYGQIDVLRQICINLIRLQHDFSAPADGYDKVDLALPPKQLEQLSATFPPLHRAPMLDAARVLLSVYREVASQVAPEHGVAYPHALDRLMSERLERLR
jgi:predicted nucleotidyltransferase